jgi:hypothetical protein
MIRLGQENICALPHITIDRGGAMSATVQIGLGGWRTIGLALGNRTRMTKET